MPEGALLTHTVEAVLQDLAASGATGCLLVRDQEGDEAEVFLRDGRGVRRERARPAGHAGRPPDVAGRPDARGAGRGAGDPADRAAGLAAGRAAGAPGLRRALEVVEEFVVEHLKDALADLLGWPVAAWKFRKNKKTRQDVAPADPGRRRCSTTCATARTTWETILAATGGPDAVPTLAAASPSDEVALGPNEWALLCKVDGHAVGRRPGRRVRVHPVRGRPGRHAAGRGRTGGRARRTGSTPVVAPE